MANFFDQLGLGLKNIFNPEAYKLVTKVRTQTYDEVVKVATENKVPKIITKEEFDRGQLVINTAWDSPVIKIAVAQKNVVEGGVKLITKVLETEEKVINAGNDLLDAGGAIIDNSKTILVVGGVVGCVLLLNSLRR